MSHWLWNESPTINTDYDIEYFNDTGGDEGTLEVPFAVLAVYTEACGGGGGGGASNISDKFFPNDAASGGAGGAWCYKTWDTTGGGNFTFSVGDGGQGANYTASGCFGGKRGKDGGNSRVTYNFSGSSFMEAGGGESGGLSQEAFGGIFSGAEGGRNGRNTKREVSNTTDAQGGKGGGAGGQGAGSLVEGKFTVSYTIYERTCSGAGDGEVCYDNYYPYTEDVTGRLCGGPGGGGVGVGGNLLNEGIDADTNASGYYRVNGKPGSLYGGGGGGSSGGHCRTDYSDCGSRDLINGGWTAQGISPGGFGGCLFVRDIRLSNTRRGGDGGDGARGFVYFGANYEPPEITYLEIQTNENLDASPTQELTVEFITNYAHEVRLLDSSGREMFKITNLDENGHPKKVKDGTETFIADHLRSAVENGISPACDMFTFYAKGPGGEVSQQVQGCIYNDDCIKDIVIPNQGPYDPEKPVELTITIEDIDMPTIVQCSQGLRFSKDGGNTNSDSGTVLNGDNLILTTQSLPFSKDERGLEHHRKLYIEFGAGTGGCEVKRLEFTVITRRPETEEIFDFIDNSLGLPYPKIDTTLEEPTEYLINSNGPITVNEVELSDPYGVQIRVKDVAKSKPYTDRETWDNVRNQNDTNSEVRVNRASSGLQPWKEPNIIGVNELPPASGPSVVEPNVEYRDPPPPVPPD